MDDYLKKKVGALLDGECLIFSNEEFDELIGLRVTNYIRSTINDDRLGTKDVWKCWINWESLVKAKADNPFSTE